MKKLPRLLIILIVLGAALTFLWPTIQWYWFTPKVDQSLALGSREKIREDSRNLATADIEKLKAMAENKSTEDLSKAGSTWSYAVKASRAAYKDLGKTAPDSWTASAILAGFSSEAAAYTALEALYRERILDVKLLQKKAIKLGLDLSGGMSVVIQADMDAQAKKLGRSLTDADRADAMKRAIEALNSRIDKFGLAEPVIRQQGVDQIYVEVPGEPDPEYINSILMGRGNLGFYIVDQDATSKLENYLSSNPTAFDEKTMTVPDPNLIPAGEVIRKFYKKDAYGLDEFTGQYMVISGTAGLDGTHITGATTASDPLTGKPQTHFQLDKEGGEIFYKLTSSNVGKTMAVVLDDRIKAGARINEPIRDSVSISGFSSDEASNLALILRSAALPVELSVVSQQAIGASLGEDTVRSGLFAVSIAFLLVILFMLLYYLGAGINTAVAELLNLFIMIGTLSAFGLTLTLPSIAGFVLTIGVSVDANVLIFERIKEELRNNKGRIASIRAGFNKAFWTIFDSHVTNLIAAIFLSQLGSGPIQGFAISLAIGTITSLFTSLFVSHLIFDFETDVLKLKHTSISWRVK